MADGGFTVAAYASQGEGPVDSGYAVGVVASA